MKKQDQFMIDLWRKNGSDKPTGGLYASEQQRIQDLLREDIIQYVYMSEDMERIWLHIKAESEEIADEIIGTLPYCRTMEYEIIRLRS